MICLESSLSTPAILVSPLRKAAAASARHLVSQHARLPVVLLTRLARRLPDSKETMEFRARGLVM